MPDRNYNRPGKVRQYISIHYHQRNSTNRYKSKWISYNIEKDTFDAADYGNHFKIDGNQPWLDRSGNLWGFLINLVDVGTKGEVFGYFDKPRNITDRWHGFPIFPFAPRAIPNELIQRWIEEGLLDGDDLSSLLKKKKI